MNAIINMKNLILVALITGVIIGLATINVAAFGESGGSGSGSGSGGSSGCGGCNDSYTPPTYTPPTYTPPTYTPPTYTPPTPSPARCVSLTSDKSSVKHGGDKVYLTWSTQGATSVTLNGSSVSASASNYEVNVTSNITYTIVATNADGSGNCAVSITVNPPVLAKCESLTVDRNLVKAGETVYLRWTTSNASSVTISNVGGNLPLNNTTGHAVVVNGNTTFILTAAGTDGNANCQVVVNTETVNNRTPHCIDLYITDTRNVSRGDTITLRWQTSGADYVEITPDLGRVSQSGSENVRITRDVTTFVLTARTGSQESTCRVTLRVNEDDDKPTPRCELEISKKRVNRGDKVTLSWDSKNADSIVIRDDRNNTVFNTADYSSSQRKRYLTGEVDVIVNRDTTFTMTARGEGGSKTCKVEVKTDDLTVYEKRDQGYVISLTQVPYTGFEAGPFLTFLFYAVLTLWALFIAYVLVIKRGAVLGLSLYAQGAAVEADIENRKKVEALVAKYSGLNQK